MPTRYRLLVTRALEGEQLPPIVVETLFVEPLPSIVWTGNGVRSDAAGRSHFVRHAIATQSARDAEDAIGFEMPKVLLIEQLRSEGVTELRKWLDVGDDVFDGKQLAIGDQIIIGYEPRRTRTRIVWPWAMHTDLTGQGPMRSIWASFFRPSDSELARQLLRWMG